MSPPPVPRSSRPPADPDTPLPLPPPVTPRLELHRVSPGRPKASGPAPASALGPSNPAPRRRGFHDDPRGGWRPRFSLFVVFQRLPVTCGTEFFTEAHVFWLRLAPAASSHHVPEMAGPATWGPSEDTWRYLCVPPRLLSDFCLE